MSTTDEPSGWDNAKDAWMWVFSRHPYTINYPGVNADLFFSSPETFKQLLGREMDDYEALVKVRVPLDFDDWDYIPNDY
jgi:hypothetical protein